MKPHEIENEKKRFKLLIEMIEHIQNIPFQSQTGKELTDAMKIAYGQIIKPIIVKKANEFVTKEEKSNS